VVETLVEVLVGRISGTHYLGNLGNPAFNVEAQQSGQRRLTAASGSGATRLEEATLGSPVADENDTLREAEEGPA
jgi:hypothetical protein